MVEVQKTIKKLICEGRQGRKVCGGFLIAYKNTTRLKIFDSENITRNKQYGKGI